MKNKNLIVIPFIVGSLICLWIGNAKLNEYQQRIEKMQNNISVLENKVDENENKINNFNNQEANRSGRTFEVQASAYTHTDEGCNRITYSENKVREGHTIAVNPSQIPIGSIVYIQNENIEGYYVAEDIGGAISHGYIDIYMESREDALNFGRQQVQVEIIRHGWSG